MSDLGRCVATAGMGDLANEAHWNPRRTEQ
jgi:hypothetical protein